MSEEKRKALIDSGQLGPDGERLHRCPLCGKPGFDPEDAARPEPVAVGTKVPKAGR